MLAVLKDDGIYPNRPDDGRGSLPILDYLNDRRSDIGNEMLNLPRKTASYHILRRQQQKETQEDDAIPRKAAN
jgi:hypothetical protein